MIGLRRSGGIPVSGVSVFWRAFPSASDAGQGLPVTKNCQFALFTRQGENGKIVAKERRRGMEKSSSMAKASMIFGIGGIVCSCTCFPGIIASALALIFGLISRTGETMDSSARTGLITGGVGLFLSFGFFIVWVIFLAHAS